MQIDSNSLAAFVAEVDSLGGPMSAATRERFENFRYVPGVFVDTALPPDSERYRQQMLSLYREISGRELNQRETEFTPVDIEALVDAESPYSFQSPCNRLEHYIRLATPIHSARLPAGAAVLDMGAGWGLSSEFLASLGFAVTAVDINPSFVELLRRRSSRLKLPISALEASFDDFHTADGLYDAVLFYESFHHSTSPSNLLFKLLRMLKPGGRVILVGEPIQDEWWPAWGLRMDLLSVYCIRKFGWFESGWSESYLTSIFRANGFESSIHRHPDPLIGTFFLASKSGK